MGDPVRSFAKKFDLEIIFGIAGQLVLVPKHECGLSFLTNMIPDSDDEGDAMSALDSKSLAVLPKNIVVKEILVRECLNTESAGNEKHGR